MHNFTKISIMSPLICLYANEGSLSYFNHTTYVRLLMPGNSFVAIRFSSELYGFL